MSKNSDFVNVEEAIEIVLKLARKGACESVDPEAELLDQQAIGTIEDFFTNVVFDGTEGPEVPKGLDMKNIQAVEAHCAALLAQAGSEWSSVLEAAGQGELYSVTHDHRHGADQFFVRAPADAFSPENSFEFDKGLVWFNSDRFELHREDEWIDVGAAVPEVIDLRGMPEGFDPDEPDDDEPDHGEMLENQDFAQDGDFENMSAEDVL